MLQQRLFNSLTKFPSSFALAGTCDCRFFSSSIAATDDTAKQGEAQVVSVDEGPTFVSFPDSRWGARSELLHTCLPSSVESLNEFVVLRDAFATFDKPVRPIGEILAPLSKGRVAVSSALSYPEARVLVDCYRRAPGGDFILAEGSVDLLRYLRRELLRVDYVPDLAAAAGGTYNGSRAHSDSALQSSNEVLMVAPTAFTFNQQAAQDNYFMNSMEDKSGTSVTQQVCREFAGLYHQLNEVAGVKVQLFSHGEEHGTPDACFPNNWFSTHPAGEAGGSVGERTLVLYPMKCPNRAAERRDDMKALLSTKGYTRVLDLTAEEKSTSPAYFEGTGVLVNDRINGVAYVALSERAHPRLAEKWVEAMGYRDLVTFHATDAEGHPVYHTNVMMAVGTDVAIVCAESVDDPVEREHLLASLRKTHAVVEITRAQMGALCGNALEVVDGRGLPAMAMSTQAYNAFTADQRATILRHCASIIHAPIDTIERIGGGGVRCTLGEIF
uniref:Amidinotransferase n=1 Tax=Tetraselmis sp. GSL018 TaxID=582737 RepID=A0A061RZ36_9CHLO